MPRLRGSGVELSQQAGGIGALRGPGETKLEVDRRRIQQRITKLERDLKRLAKTRATQRKARRRRALMTVALVGYTNAGKSTLLNHMTRSEVIVEDRLFSTLDPTTRRLHLPGGETVLCSDTVGFVRRLPHQLVQAFRSTLEEVAEADLLVHVVDATATDALAQIDAVRTVLDEIGAGDLPEIVAVNKTDAADPEAVSDVLSASGGIAVSARTGEGVEKLVEAIGDRLRALAAVIELVVPYERGDVLAALHRDGEVLVEVHADTGTRVRARLDRADVARFGEFVAGAT
jgi:GTP-binding protein HflX